jgi:hypothetical protein
MRLYAGTATQFITDTNLNQIADKLKDSFVYYYRCSPSPSEVRAWNNSLRAVAGLFSLCKLADHGVILEYQLPLSSLRLDCMVTGKDDSRRGQAIIIELKQWEKCRDADGENEVTTYLGKGEREVLHPSAQVGRYKEYLEDYHTAFYEGNDTINLGACTYLHNYSFESNDVLLSKKFENTLRKFPLFSKDDVPALEEFISPRLIAGQGIDVLNRILEGKHRPSKTLMDHVAGIIEGKDEFVLLDEQQVVFDKVLSLAERGFHDKRKTVLLIKGGPGTGKSVIAINLMASLLRKGFNAQYVTGSKAFTQTLRAKIGTRGSAQFKYFNSYSGAERNEIDVLICDEAHRLRETSNSRFTRRVDRSKIPQVQELLNAGKAVVFFIDENQVVRPSEIGSYEYIRNEAAIGGAKLAEYELEVQFRCGGSDAFVKWIENTLGIKRTPNVLWSQNESFDFQIMDSPETLEKAIREKSVLGFKARMVAGFCWPWSKKLDRNEALHRDVVIGDYRRPWNAHPDIGKLPKGIPKAPLWADSPNGIDQIGCIYTAQGFEFDYAGVIFGTDLRYNLDRQEWEGHPEDSCDSVVKRAKGKFIDLVRHTYRVLLSRAMKGCYVCFLDNDTERFFRSRMEKPEQTGLTQENTLVDTKHPPHVSSLSLFLPSLIKEADLESGANSTPYPVPPGDYNKDDFLVQIEDDRMAPALPKGSVCLFRRYRGEPCSGEVILCLLKGYIGPAFICTYNEKSELEVHEGKPKSKKNIALAFVNSYFQPIRVQDPKDIVIVGVFNMLIE